MAQEIQIPFTSRFKKTPVFEKDGKVFYGLWVPPEIKMDGNEKEIEIDRDFGNLDLIAHREYGDRSLYWAIALVNNIKDIESTIKPGMKIKIPKRNNINSALTDSAVVR